MNGGFKKIRWLRVLLGAFLVELVLFAVVVPLRFLPNGLAIELAAVLPACLVAAGLGGWWVARGASSWLVLHGLLTGTLAAIFYAALTWKVSLPLIFVIANDAKLVAGALGGAIAEWQRRRRPVVASATPPVA